ncbi:hypothetical protein RE428_44010 [Marinobacter nanhaiticus D15-8W]|uniref:Metallophosphoesterase n=1 Tax=Marinobacter nanhaiticus D15-8W TaxID=626887 RepID=N6W6B4_9GAMM|nr:metallophosphatase domain-containing protein [Marinobacter nanhaiticus]ENO15759.1 metallophosphoesterase [Marinobacter nanhaiticus D15-8W]BES73383.1 hypothetical protein RE428_44010 [Marinobacter nanhaiticus D15-8W]
MRIVSISDTHSMHRQITDIPEGDVLVHAGDCLGRGALSELEDLNDWLGSMPHTHKLLIAGNHDWCFQTEPELARQVLTNATYLEGEGITLEGVKFWGSPYTPRFQNWAFQLDRGPELERHWQQIPGDTDVLITHGPPGGVFDAVMGYGGIERVGCFDLIERIEQLSLRAHIFGHIHEGYGSQTRPRDNVSFVNASICDERYRPINRPITIDLPS